MTDASISIGIRGDVSGGRRVQRSLDQVSQSATRAESSTGRLQSTVRETDRSFLSFANAVRAAAGALAIREFVQVVDNFRLLEARIQNATDNAEDFERAFNSLRETAQETGSEFATTVDIFQRISIVRDQIGATNEDILQFTESVSQLGVISGASTGALNAGLLQLGQGLGNGILRAEEFNSIIENTPEIANAIAEGFEINTAELRNLVLAGEVLSQDVFSAILNQSQQINEQFQQFPQTVGRAFNNLIISISQAAEEIDNASNLSLNLIKIIDRLADSVAAIPRLFELLRERVEVTFDSIILRAERLRSILPFSGDDRSTEFSVRETALENRFQNINSEIVDIISGSRELNEELEKQDVQTREISKNYENIAQNISNSSQKTKDIEDTTKNYQIELERVTRDSQRLDDTYERFGNRVGSVFSDFLTGATDARGVLRSLLNDLFRFINVSQGGTGSGNIFGNLFQGIFGNGVLGSSGGIVQGVGGGLGGILSSGGIIPGFANGGSFNVGGRPGVDRNLLSLNGSPVARVSRGETVNVSPQGSGVIVNQSINLSMGVDTAVQTEVRRVLPEIQRSTVAAVNEATQRGIT